MWLPLWYAGPERAVSGLLRRSRTRNETVPAASGSNVTRSPGVSSEPGAEDPVHFQHGQLTYLQIPSLDYLASAVFYERVFGWQVEGPHASFEAPGVFGQWVDDRAPTSDSGLMAWIHVDDIDAALDLARAHGGKVVDGPTADGPNRLLASVLDPGGNAIGLVQHRAG